MNKRYKQLYDRIQQVDFDSLYPGFQPYEFALYDAHAVWFKDRTIPWNETFIGNTAINYNGQPIAIWNMVDTYSDLDVLASKLIHEMFHAHQFTIGETRFPNEMDGLEYDYDTTNIQLKIQETQYLTQALNGSSRDAFETFLDCRTYRTHHYPSNLRYESHIEVVEGTARYVELRALQQLNEATFQQELETTLSFVSTPSNYVPIRLISYHIGALLLFVCNQLGIPLTKTDVTYSQALLADRELRTPNVSYESIDVSFIKTYYTIHQQQIDDILNNDHTTIEAIKLTGLDPMNTVKVGKYYLCTHFVRVQTLGDEINIFGESVLERRPDGIFVHQRHN